MAVIRIVRLVAYYFLEATRHVYEDSL
jgi:hypothetical protein